MWNNVNLILNTYKYIFSFQTAAENLRCCWTASTKTRLPRLRGMTAMLEMALEIRKSIMNKMIEVSNVNKLTTARTKMEVGKFSLQFFNR